MAAPLNLWDNPDNASLLGTMTDTALARQLHVATSVVRMARVRRGIPVYVPPDRRARSKPPGRRPVELPAGIAAKLGKESDAALAAQAGASEGVIRRARMTAGIPPFGPVRLLRERADIAALPEPTPQAIAAAREHAGHSPTQATAVARLSSVNWNRYESGGHGMDLARWELYLLLTDQHPTLAKPLPR